MNVKATKVTIPNQCLRAQCDMTSLNRFEISAYYSTTCRDSQGHKKMLEYKKGEQLAQDVAGKQCSSSAPSIPLSTNMVKIKY